MILNELAKTFLPVIKRLIPDEGKAADMAHEIALLAMQQESKERIAQVELNKAEAAAGPWRGGWRPAVGWACAFAFASNYVFIPLLQAFAAYQGNPVEIKPFDMSTMMPVMLGMLGLAGTRSWDKAKGVDR